MGTDPDAEHDVRYPLPQFAQSSRTVVVLTLVAAVCMVLSIVWQLWRGRIPALPMAALAALAYSGWRVHARGRDAVATAEGITGPHLRKPILWSDVAWLQEPLRYDPQIFVELRDGHRRGTGFPAEYFDRISALAQVPVRPKETTP